MPEQLDILPPARYLGLDLDTKSIKLVEVEAALQGIQLTKFAAETVVSKDHGVTATSAAIKKLFTSLNIEKSEIYASLSGLAVSIRRLRIPEMPETEIRGAIKWEAKNYLPFPVENIHIDYSILGKIKENNVSKLDVLAVAVPQEEINNQINLVESAGFKIAGLTVAPFALWDLMKGHIKSTDGSVLAIIDLGAESASINLFKDHTLQFTREISVAGESLTKCLTGTIVADNFQLNLNRDQAENIKIKYGIPAEDSPEKTAEGIPLSQIRAAMKPTLRRLINEVQRSFDYYKEQFLEEKIEKIYLSGGSSQTLNLPAFLSENFGIPTEVIDPLQNVKLHPSLASKENELRSLSPRLMLALGLALGQAKSLNLIRDQKKKKKPAVPTRSPQPHPNLPKLELPKFDYSKIKLNLNIGNLPKLLSRFSPPLVLPIAGAILLIILVICYYFYLGNQINYYRKELNDKKVFLQDIKALIARRSVINQITQQETKVKETLGKVASILPAGVILESLEYQNSSRDAHISGTCTNIQKTGALVKAIESSPYFSAVKLKSAKKISDATGKKAFFELTFHVE